MDRLREKSTLLIATITVAAVGILLWQKCRKPQVKLHPFQMDFLDSMAAACGLASAGLALQKLVEDAMFSDVTRSAIYDDFHCCHCGSNNPADWIKKRKGKPVHGRIVAEPYALDISDEALTFLSTKLLVPVEKVGQPPKRISPSLRRESMISPLFPSKLIISRDDSV